MPPLFHRRALWLSIGIHLALGGGFLLGSKRFKVAPKLSLSEVSLAKRPGKRVHEEGGPSTAAKESERNNPRDEHSALPAPAVNINGPRDQIELKYSTVAAQNYAGLLRQRILEHQHYPLEARKRGLSGVIEVSFELTRTGEILKIIEAAAPESKSLLQQAARAAIRDAAPFAEPPAGISLQFRIPIEFTLRN